MKRASLPKEKHPEIHSFFKTITQIDEHLIDIPNIQ